MDSVLEKKVYSKADQKYVEYMAESANVLESASAILVWTAAAHGGLADRQKLEDLLYRLTIQSNSATEATLHALEFRSLVRIPVVRPDRTSLSGERSSLSKGQDESSVSRDERAFVERALSSKEPADVGDGATLLVTKHDLGSADRAWATAALDERLAGANGPILEFLTFVKRVVKERSPIQR